MGWRGLFEGWHFVVLIVLVIVIFGWKRLPDAARSLGRSMRILKSEVEEMKHDPKPSAASRDTVHGETVNTPHTSAPHPQASPTPDPSAPGPVSTPGASGTGTPGTPSTPTADTPGGATATPPAGPPADPAPQQDQAGSAQDAR